jgi:membrane associated rhomboid family serine protease
VPGDRLPFLNWLIIAAIITVFVLQRISIREQAAKLPAKLKEVENRSVEDVAKEFGVEEQRLKKIKEAAEKTATSLKEFMPQKNVPAKFEEELVKRAILSEYFVWGKIKPFILNGWKLKGLFGHIWLHGGVLHLLGNMLFLWIFGNAVCAKVGNLRYLPIYLGLGLISGIAHLTFTGSNMLGASGAINGIVGMYLVFFPTNDITCYFVLFLRPIKFSLSSIWMILFWLTFDVWGAAKGGGQVAYAAHLGGFAGGFALGILMLKLKIVTMERYEKSLLQVLADYKKPAADEFKPQYEGYLGMIQKEMQDQPKSIATSPHPEQKTIVLEPEIPKEEFIRFTCPCGKRLKMPLQYAGRVGRCPKCNAHVRIPDK